MDESATQAVQLGVNVTIFIVSLTLAINLLIGVRDVAETASEYNESIPEGSRIVSVEKNDIRTINGYELLAYYSNYMSEQASLTSSGKYVITIKGKYSGEITNGDVESSGKTIKEFFKNKMDLNAKYEVITEQYDSENQVLYLTIKEI